MIKRRLAAALAVVMLFVSGGCGADGSGDERERTLTIAVTSASDEIRDAALFDFAQKVEEKTDGTLHIEITDGGRLAGNELDLIAEVQRSHPSVDMVITSAAYLGEYGVPSLEISTLPYMFPDVETARDFMDSDLEQRAEEGLSDKNIHVVARFCLGFRVTTNSVHSIYEPEDLSGLIMRTPEGSTMMDIYSTFGAVAMPLPFSDLYSALEQGSFDGEENPIVVIYQNRLYEVQQYLSLTNHTYSPLFMMMNESVWESLSDEQRAAITEAANEAVAAERIDLDSSVEECLNGIMESGVEVNTPNLEAFMNATSELRKRQAQEYSGLYADAVMWLDRR